MCCKTRGRRLVKVLSAGRKRMDVLQVAADAAPRVTVEGVSVQACLRPMPMIFFLWLSQAESARHIACFDHVSTQRGRLCVSLLVNVWQAGAGPRFDCPDCGKSICTVSHKH